MSGCGLTKGKKKRGCRGCRGEKGGGVGDLPWFDSHFQAVCLGSARGRVLFRGIPATPVLEKGVCAAVRHMAAPAPFLHPALWSAVVRGRTEDVSQLLKGGANTEERGGLADNLTTPLQIAFEQGDVESFQLLLEHGADISNHNDAVHGGTLLHWAAMQELHDKGDAITLLLLQHGADVSAQDNEQMTPLLRAAIHDRAAVAQVLLENGADVNYKGPQGGTALHRAVSGGHEAVVRLLIAHRANVLAEAINGATPLDFVHQAASEAHPEVVAMVKAEAVIRAKCVAFAMGHHARLGAGSMLEGLEPEVLRTVLGQV